MAPPKKTPRRKATRRRRRRTVLSAAQRRALQIAIRASALARKQRGGVGRGQPTIAYRTKADTGKKKATRRRRKATK